MAALADMLQELTNIPQSDRQRTKQTALLINALQTLAECTSPLLSQLSTLVDRATALPPQPARYTVLPEHFPVHPLPPVHYYSQEQLVCSLLTLSLSLSQFTLFRFR